MSLELNVKARIILSQGSDAFMGAVLPLNAQLQNGPGSLQIFCQQPETLHISEGFLQVSESKFKNFTFAKYFILSVFFL